MSLEVDIRKRYGDFHLDVRFEAEGRFALMGASGSGKSLTLQAVAGVMKPDAGRIVLDGEVLFDAFRGVNLPPQRRGVGLMFQHYALFPTMTVAQNIACGLRAKRLKNTRERVETLVGRLRLDGLERLYPSQLSGGQQQRVALARILASEPRLILLDEPFSALDSHLRRQLELEVAEALDGFSGTSLMVTHDFQEAFHFCGNMAVLDMGRVCASGEKWGVYQNPGTLAAARMTGCQNISRAERAGPNRLRAMAWGIELTAARPIPSGTRYVGVRAEAIRAADPLDVSCANRFLWNATGGVENPTCGILGVALGGKTPLQWALPREDFLEYSRAGHGTLVIPPECVHALTDS